MLHDKRLRASTRYTCRYNYSIIRCLSAFGKDIIPSFADLLLEHFGENQANEQVRGVKFARYVIISGVARIFFGGHPGHFKAITRPRRGVRGQEPPPRMETRFKFLKRCKVLENDFIFQEFQPFFPVF